MKIKTLMVTLFALAVLTFGSIADARHVYVRYIDNGRPTQFAKADVLSAIQRTLREWEAHNSITSLVFHWVGEDVLANAPADFDNLVIRWAGAYTNFRAISCPSYYTCAGSGQPDVPTNHVLLSSAISVMLGTRQRPCFRIRRTSDPVAYGTPTSWESTLPDMGGTSRRSSSSPWAPLVGLRCCASTSPPSGCYHPRQSRWAMASATQADM